MLKIHGVCLQEECAEVIQAVSKILRFGLEQKNPLNGVRNKTHLAEELDQLEAMINIVRCEWGIGSSNKFVQDVKRETHFKWLDKFPQTEMVQEYVR